MHYLTEEDKEKIFDLRRQGLTFTQIEKITGSSRKTISKYCKEAGLSESPRKTELTDELLQEIQNRYDNGESLKALSAEYHTAWITLRKHGIKIKDSDHETYTPQASCAQKTKLKAVAYKGGKCIICGYNKCMSALDFHHINPEEKDFGVSGTTKSFEKLKPELDKCILLCRNCHAEVHAGIINLQDYNLVSEPTEEFYTLYKPVDIKSIAVSNYKIQTKLTYPTKEELYKKYEELGTWLSVRQFYHIGSTTLKKIREENNEKVD